MAQIIPVLRAFDYNKLIQFYIEWLGCSINWQHTPDNAPFYMQLSLRDVVIELSEHHGDCSPGAKITISGFTGLKDFHMELKAKGYKFMNPGLEVSAWDKSLLEMTVIDPFYNHIVFTEHIESN